MRTVPYSKILAGSGALCGFSAADLGETELALFSTWHDRRLQVAWEYEDWPDLRSIEQRTFRPLWNGGVTYAATDELFDVPSSQYFQSLQAGNLGHPPTVAGVEDSAWWAACATSYTAPDWVPGTVFTVGQQTRNPMDQRYYQCTVAHTAGAVFDPASFGVLTPFNRFIAYNQVGQTPLGEVFEVTDKDPRLTTKTVKLPYQLSADGVQMNQLKHEFAFVWLRFRRQRPELGGESWDASTSYQTGQAVYFVNVDGLGDFWTANQGTAPGESPAFVPGKWDMVVIPYIFRGYLIAAGAADWLDGDGQNEKAAGMEGTADGYLALEGDKLFRQQGQTNRLKWKR